MGLKEVEETKGRTLIDDYIGSRWGSSSINVTLGHGAAAENVWRIRLEVSDSSWGVVIVDVGFLGRCQAGVWREITGDGLGLCLGSGVINVRVGLGEPEVVLRVVIRGSGVGHCCGF